MSEQDIQQALNELRSDVGALLRWTATHDRRHVTDDDRLNLLLVSQDQHAHNHHGKGTVVKQSAAVVAIVTVLGALGELTGWVELLRLLPFLS